MMDRFIKWTAREFGDRLAMATLIGLFPGLVCVVLFGGLVDAYAGVDGDQSFSEKVLG